MTHFAASTDFFTHLHTTLSQYHDLAAFLCQLNKGRLCVPVDASEISAI